MLTQLAKLQNRSEGRYATDHELQFIQDYVASFSLRLGTYTKLQKAESLIVQQVYNRLTKFHPDLLKHDDGDASRKWKGDTVRVLRYAAIAMLLDDQDSFQERFLFWFQTLMKAFKTQQSCNVTYRVMQEVVRDYLTVSEATIFCPILELTRRSLSGS